MDDYGDTIDTASPFVIGESLSGAINPPGDVDVFAIIVAAGTTYRFGGLRFVTATIIDENGQTLATQGPTGELLFSAETDGTFYLRLTSRGITQYTIESSIVSDEIGDTIETATSIEVGQTISSAIDFDADLDFYAVELVEGSDYIITTSINTFSGSSHTILDSEGVVLVGPGFGISVLTASYSGTYYIQAQAKGIANEYDINVRINDDVGATIETAGQMDSGRLFTGRLDFLSDVDLYAITLEAGEEYRFSVRDGFGEFGTILFVLDASGEIVAGDNGGALEFISYTPETDGVFYLNVATILGLQQVGEYELFAAQVGDTRTSNGDDYVIGSDSDDVIFGLDGDDLVLGENGLDRFFGGDGNDTAFGGDGNDQLRGEAGDDTLNGEAGIDTIFGGIGNDAIDGGLGNDRLYGERGNDMILAGDGDDVALGQEGEDLINGGAGRDLIWGGEDNDIINGDEGDDILRGNDGDDTLNGGLGADNMQGGAGINTLNGGDGNDKLIGVGSHDVLNGGDGDDFLLSGDGTSEIFGGAGRDFMIGGAGADTMDGGIGNDSLFGNEGDDVMIGGEGFNRLFGGDDNDDLTGGSFIDWLFGGTGNDILRGGGNADELYGEGGDDQIFGEGGNDLIRGNDGIDVIDGGSGNDNINGNAGADTLTGGAGADLLFGGSEIDTFVFAAGDALSGAFDRILDLEAGELIDLGSHSFVGEGAFTGGGSFEVRYSSDGTTTRLQLDRDGDGAAEELIVISGEFDFTSDGALLTAATASPTFDDGLGV